MLDARFSHLYFYQSLNRLQRGLSAIAELLVFFLGGGAVVLYIDSPSISASLSSQFNRTTNNLTHCSAVVTQHTSIGLCGQNMYIKTSKSYLFALPEFHDLHVSGK